MNTRKRLAGLRNVFVALLAAFFITACGGSGESGSSTEPLPEPVNFGSVGLWFTDLPTDDFDSITLLVSAAYLMGGDDSRQVLFENLDKPREIDLLDLTNYSEPVYFGEVQAGTYTKIRLMIDDILLLPKGSEEFVSVEKLPANGKVDLLQADGFDVVPGRTVTIEIDVDANKAIHVVNAGNSGKIKFRPVVKVNIYDGGLPDKLARIKGVVTGEPDGSTGSFVVCSIANPDHCVDVTTDSTPETGTSFFNVEGTGTDFSALADGAMVVVIGNYSLEPYALNAVVVEINSIAEQVTGEVVTEPAESRFLVLTIGDESLEIELQPETKFYNADGPIDVSAVVLGARVEVEGVRPTTDSADDPDFRAALVFLEAPQDTLLSGTVTPMSQVEETGSFELVPEGEGVVPVNVCLAESAVILLVNTTEMTVGPGEFDDIVDDASVDVFGTPADPEGENCFKANEVIVDVTPEPSS